MDARRGPSTGCGYWGNFVISLLLAIALIALVVVTGIQGMFFLMAVYGIAIFIPQWAISVRRLHDSGKSAWFLLFYLVPFIGAIVMIIFFVLPSEDDNKYGARPD